MAMTDKLVIMKMSDAYERQSFYRHDDMGNWDTAVIDARNLPGTDGYCDDGAKEQLRRLTAGLSPEGVHFLDSGNYHYLSLLWLEKIRRPFSLVLIDRHTDMQPPSFGEITSCGGWVREALRTLPGLRRVYLYGVGEQEPVEKGAEVRQWEQEPIEKRAQFCSWEQLPEPEFPVYISLDKDAMGREDARCDWDQGDADLEQVLGLINRICSAREVIGMDVCGDSSRSDSGEADCINDRTNCEILSRLAAFTEAG